MQKNVSIYTQLANKYGISPRIVEVICNHPFKFANRVISDDNNDKSIMFGYLFKIKKKKKYGRKEER